MNLFFILQYKIFTGNTLQGPVPASVVRRKTDHLLLLILKKKDCLI